MAFSELEVLANEAVGEAGGDADLIKGKRFFMQEHDTGKILDVTANGTFTMTGALLDIGELMTGEVQIEDLSFVGLTPAHFLPPATGRKNDALAAHLAHVSLNGDNARGENESKVLVGENAALLNGLIGHADDLVLPQGTKTGLPIDGQIFLRLMQR